MSDSKSGGRQYDPSLILEPPTSIGGILYRLGPGLIVAGSIVGSGELIATTKTGAEAGFWLLWLILIGCVIKVFVQVELGRYTITSGRTAMSGLNSVPGPRVGKANWLVWFWFVMFLASLAQLGGIVGGVGQALAISVPLTEHGRFYKEYADHRTTLKVKDAQLAMAKRRQEEGTDSNSAAAIAELTKEIETRKARLLQLRKEQSIADGEEPKPPWDARIWATILTVLTAGVLMRGRYNFIQSFSTFMVASFTLLTVINVCMLQSHADWSVSMTDIRNGLSFGLPPSDNGITTALATFGIIGVGASELITYPYWCLEKGYAQFTGPNEKADSWVNRACGWMRVMRWDAWCSMVIYTFATIAFYLLGAATLGRIGLSPEKNDMIRTLGVMYEPVFGATAQILFLFGAFAVLYSTFFVANASHARVFPDALRVLGITADNDETYRKYIRVFSGFFPFACLTFYLFIDAPAQLVLFSGLMQAIMLPMIAGAAVYFRYKKSDKRISPGRSWDIFLWISAAGMLISGGWAVFDKIQSKDKDKPAAVDKVEPGKK